MFTSNLSIYMEFLEIIPDGALIADQFGEIVHVNDQFLGLFEVDHRFEYVGQGVEVLIPEAMRQRHRLLRWITSVASGQLRRNDLITRVGGDEFAVLLTDARIEGVEHRITDLMAVIQDAMNEQAWPVTLSTGVVSFEKPPMTPDDVIAVVDDVMYRAKKSGKDAVVFDRFAENRDSHINSYANVTE